ncbi:MAG TPA: hypothetical protein VF897_11625 [Roseiflexaceae bacterium]
MVIVIMLLASTGAGSGAATRMLAVTPAWTPCVDDDSDAYYDCLDLRDNLTATAEALAPTGGTSTATTESTYPYPGSGTTSATQSATQGGTPGTPSPGATLAATQGGLTASPTTTRTPGPSEATPGGASDLSAATPTPTATPTDAITCAPGVPVTIDGTGPPRAPLLLYFDERAVGGGSVEPDGHFSLDLTVGQERPGIYDVAVRVRGTTRVLRQLQCSVPDVTPTPAPADLGRR